MTKALVTVRNGASATYIHDVAMATAWIHQLAATLLPAGNDIVTKGESDESTVQAKAEVHIKGQAKKAIFSAPPKLSPNHAVDDNHDKDDPSTIEGSQRGTCTQCICVQGRLSHRCDTCNHGRSSYLCGTCNTSSTEGDEDLGAEGGLKISVEHAGSENLRMDQQDFENELAQTLHQRLAILEEALSVQAATGASHLQKLEMNPTAYGLRTSIRPYVKDLRQRRNMALHAFVDHGLIPSLPTTQADNYDDKPADHDNKADKKSADDNSADDKTVDDKPTEGKAADKALHACGEYGPMTGMPTRGTPTSGPPTTGLTTTSLPTPANTEDKADHDESAKHEKKCALCGTVTTGKAACFCRWCGQPLPGAVGGSWTTAPPHPIHRQAKGKAGKRNRFR